MDAAERGRQARQLRRFILVQRRNRTQNVIPQDGNNTQPIGFSFCRDMSVVNAIYSQSIVNVDGTIETRTQIANPTSSIRCQQNSQEGGDSSNVGQPLTNNRRGQSILENFFILNLIHLN